MKTYIISDTHFNHQLLIDKYWRPKDFEKQLKIKRGKIKKTDRLIHLWDICIGKDAEMHSKYIKPLLYRKILVRWNHDTKSDSWYLNNGRDEVHDRLWLQVESHNILFTHIPMPADELPKGWFNIHWHIHDRPIEPISDHHFLYSPEINSYCPREIAEFIWYF